MKRRLSIGILTHGLLIVLWGVFFYKGILIEDEKYFNLISIISLSSIVCINLINLSLKEDRKDLCSFLVLYSPLAILAFVSTNYGIRYLLPSFILIVGTYGVMTYKKIDLYVLRSISFVPVSRKRSSKMVIIILIFATIILYLFNLSGIQINIIFHLIFLIFELSFLFFIIDKERPHDKINLFLQISEYTAKEREEFARVIHDDVIQDLYALKNHLSFRQPDIATSMDLISSLESRLRKIMNFYKSQVFEDAKAYENIETVFSSIKPLYPNKNYQEIIDITENGEQALKDRNILRTSLLVAKELINNIYKHSQGSYILIFIDVEDEKLLLRIESDGAKKEDFNRIKESKGGVLLLKAMLETKGNSIEYELNKDILKTQIIFNIDR